MSTQTGIVSTFDSKKLWTVPAKEQYLPSYFKRLCDEYMSSENPRRVFPVEVSETDHFNVRFLCVFFLIDDKLGHNIVEVQIIVQVP